MAFHPPPPAPACSPHARPPLRLSFTLISNPAGCTGTSRRPERLQRHGHRVSPPGGVPALMVLNCLAIRTRFRPSRFKSGTVGPPLRSWWRQQQIGATRFSRNAREGNLDKCQLWDVLRTGPVTAAENTIGSRAGPPRQGRQAPRDSRTSRRQRNDEVLGALELLQHRRGLNDERLPLEGPFSTGITSPMAFHPLPLLLPALPMCGLRYVSPSRSSRMRWNAQA